MSSFLENAALAVETDNHIDVNLNLFIEKLRSNQMGSTIDLENMGWFRLLSVPSFQKLTDAILDMNNTNPNWKLISLNLSNNNTVGSTAGMRVLSNLLKRSKNTWSLSTLKLTKNGINGEAFKELVDGLVTRKEQGDTSPVFGSLRNLNMWENSIGDQGLLEIGRLVQSLPLLEQIHLKANRGITEKGFESFEKSLEGLSGKMSVVPSTKIDLSNTIKKGYFVVTPSSYIKEGIEQEEEEEEGFVEGCFNTEELLSREPLRPENVVFRAHERPDPNKKGSFVQDCYTNDDLTWFEREDYNWSNAENLVHDPFSPEDIKKLKEAIRNKNPNWRPRTFAIKSNTPLGTQQNREEQERQRREFEEEQSVFLQEEAEAQRRILQEQAEARRIELNNIVANINSNRIGPWLNLTRKNLTLDELLPIADALKVNNSTHNSTHHIGVTRNQFGDDGARVLADVLGENKNIYSIDLINNNITDVGVEALAKVLEKRPTSTKLDLTNNRITNVGCMSLADAIRQNNLLMSQMHENDKIIPDDFMSYINFFKETVNIWLNLSNNDDIGESGIKALADAIKSTINPRFIPKVQIMNYNRFVRGEDRDLQNNKLLSEAYDEVKERLEVAHNDFLILHEHD